MAEKVDPKMEVTVLLSIVHVSPGQCSQCIAGGSDEACVLLSAITSSYCAGKGGYFKSNTANFNTPK